MLASHSDGLDEKIDDPEKTIARASGKNQTSRLLDEIPAFGPLIASAMVAFNPDPSVVGHPAPQDLGKPFALPIDPIVAGRLELLLDLPKFGSHARRNAAVLR